MNFQKTSDSGQVSICTALLSAFLCCPALAVHKCVVDTKTTYQELPCEQSLPTVVQELVNRESQEVLHRRLDSMLASGVGVKNRADQKQTESAKMDRVASVEAQPQEDEKFQPQPRTRANREAKQAEANRQSYQESLAKNAKASQQMQKDYDEMLKLCSGKTFKHPVVGMTDEQFRLCTLPNRLGAIERVVVAEDKGVALRLYVSPTQPATRVYSIGGVVTAVKL